MKYNHCEVCNSYRTRLLWKLHRHLVLCGVKRLRHALPHLSNQMRETVRTLIATATSFKELAAAIRLAEKSDHGI